MNRAVVKRLLNEKAKQFNNPSFIKNDPISIPHLFEKKQDIEISGLFSAALAWGQRKTIIENNIKLMQLMEMSPYEFITQHEEKDLERFSGFVHRTFNTTDLLYFIYFLKNYYQTHSSLEDAFVPLAQTNEEYGYDALRQFHHIFFSLDILSQRTRKHIATPERNSACKRLNMYLRWMVRRDDKGVDFGIWARILPSQLICPLDVHVQRVARSLQLLTRKQNDWKAAIELTRNLRMFNHDDPVIYDYALFGLGVMEKWR